MTKEIDLEREIEFRAWHRQQKYIYDNIAVSDEHTVGYEAQKNNFNAETSKDIVVLQFTGRRDKNGKKIFEGDILKVNRVAGPVVVRWNDEAVGFVLENPQAATAAKRQVDWPGGERSIKILGNIFENPEILEKEDED
jgi:uncharacterized phage protein (TIGR01671 family)